MNKGIEIRGIGDFVSVEVRICTSPTTALFNYEIDLWIKG